MADISQTDIRTIPLTPDLRSSSYELQTNWHVIAGGPSSGKTTLINQLANCGYTTVPETARLYIDQELAKGRTIEEIRGNQTDLQYRFVDMQLEVERSLKADDFLILDRALPDCFGYCRCSGVDPNEFLSECFHHRYASVFILARVPFTKDGARDRDFGIADYLSEWTCRDYLALGYDIIRVPVLSLEERLSYVLDRLPGGGGG